MIHNLQSALRMLFYHVVHGGGIFVRRLFEALQLPFNLYLKKLTTSESLLRMNRWVPRRRIPLRHGLGWYHFRGALRYRLLTREVARGVTRLAESDGMNLSYSACATRLPSSARDLSAPMMGRSALGSILDYSEPCWEGQSKISGASHTIFKSEATIWVMVPESTFNPGTEIVFQNCDGLRCL